MLPQLSDFFGPLNLYNLFLFFLVFVFLDNLGYYVQNRFFKLNNIKENRVLSWLIGLGFFMFVWFVLSLFIPYTRENILLSMLVLLTPTLPTYIKNKEFFRLCKTLWGLKFPILIIIPFLPAVFIKASLPPYYSDEMAYHYIPPSSLIEMKAVRYAGGLYADLPRILNLFWELIFSLTKTYSIARLFHFTILVTAMLFTYSVVRKYFGVLSAVIFYFVFFSIPQDIILTSTLGYIDVGAYSFLLIGLVFTVAYIKQKDPDFFLFAVLFWALNLGSKYTGISSFGIGFFLVSLIVFFSRGEYLKGVGYKFLGKVLFVFLLFGGYWYVKNLILFGNPVFPFFFQCWGTHIEPCAQSGGFFGNWTTPVNLENSKLILSQLFTRNYVLRNVIVISAVFLFFVKDVKTKKVLLYLYLTVFLELLFLKYFSGFYIRYHQHMQLFLLMGTAIILSSKSKIQLFNIVRYVLIFAVFASSMYLYIWNIKYVNSLRFLNGLEVRYAAGKINIYNWIDAKFPDTKDVIRWCDGGKGKEFVNLGRYDPDLIWFTNDGLTRVFMIRCKFVNPNVDTSDLSKIVDSAVANKQKFWITSINDCQKDSDVKPKYEYEKDYQFKLRQIDNKIICNSKKEFKSLYYFDYTDHLNSGKDYNIEY